MEAVDYNPFVSGTNISLAATPEIVWWIFGSVIALFFIISAVFLFHWVTYSFGDKRTKLMGTLYFTVSALLLGILFFATLYYISSL